MVHVGSDVRERFCELSAENHNGWIRTLEWYVVCGQLWHSTDVVPGATCDELGMLRGTTYASAARRLRAWWNDHR